MALAHFAHATHADLRGDFVRAEAGAGRKGQTAVMDYTDGAPVPSGLLQREALPRALPALRYRRRAQAATRGTR